MTAQINAPAAVNLAEVFARLEEGLMALLTSGPAAQVAHMVAVERLCAIARDTLDGDNVAVDALTGIAERAPVIAGLMLVPEGLRERAFSESVRLLTTLKGRATGRAAA